MCSNYKRTLLLIFPIYIALYSSAFGVTANELLLCLVNDARVNPVRMVERIGKDPRVLVAQNPDLADVFDHGLSPVAVNDALSRIASALNGSMLEQCEGGSCEKERGFLDVLYKGNVFRNVKRTSGLITFDNYIDTNAGVWYLFRNLFSRELSLPKEKWSILSNRAQIAGICFGEGRVKIASQIVNAYGATMVFAEGVGWQDTSCYERAISTFLNCINLARQDVTWLSKFPGVNEGLIAWYADIAGPLSPIVPSSGLSAVAAKYANLDLEVIEKERLGRYEGMEQELVWTDCSTSIVSAFVDTVESPAPVTSPVDLARRVFLKVMIKIQEGLPCDELALFRRTTDRLGMGIGLKVIVSEDGSLLYRYQVVCILGQANVKETPYIVGLVYRDLDQDGSYSPGEGVNAARIKLDTPSGFYEDRTDEEGLFAIALNTIGLTLVQVNGGVSYGGLDAWVLVRDENVYVVSLLPRE